MGSVMFIILFVCVAGIAADGYLGRVGKGVCKGKFKYNGVDCKWIEVRITGSQRGLSIKCGNTLSTKYQGNPHTCPWYKDGNQCDYYKCLVKVLNRKDFTAAQPQSVFCDNHCEDVEFIKL